MVLSAKIYHETMSQRILWRMDDEKLEK